MRKHGRRSRLAAVGAVSGALAAVAIGGCASQAPIALESGPSAEITHDGLVRVRWSRFQRAWIKPGADFARYTHVMMDPVSISYKRPPNPSRSIPTGNDLQRGNFELTDRQADEMKRSFSAAFDQALSKLTNFEQADSADPRTLRVQAALIDLVINVPTRQPTGSTAIATASPATMTLVLEARDSLSGEILARVADRRKAGAGSVTANLQRNIVMINSGALRMMFRRWAEILARRLDQLHDSPPVEAPGVVLPATPEPPLDDLPEG